MNIPSFVIAVLGGLLGGFSGNYVDLAGVPTAEAGASLGTLLGVLIGRHIHRPTDNGDRRNSSQGGFALLAMFGWSFACASALALLLGAVAVDERNVGLAIASSVMLGLVAIGLLTRLDCAERRSKSVGSRVR